MSLPHYLPPPGHELRQRPGDLTLTTLLMVLYGALFGLSTFVSPFLFMASDSCTDRTCDYNEMTLGIGVFALGPWLPLVVAIVGVIRRSRRGVSSWWIPLVAAPLSFAILCGGIALISDGGP